MKLFSQTMWTLITACRKQSSVSNCISSIAGLDWIVRCFTSSPTQYRLYGRLRTCR